MSGFFKKLNTLKASLESHLDGPSRQPSPAYWIASFSPNHPVTEIFRRETGDHGWGNAELENYTDSDRNSFFRPTGNGGHSLVLKAIAEGDSLTSARLTSYVTLGRDRGYLSARITAPSARGIWPAFWLLPSEPFSWPTDGEVDIMESWNGDRVNHSCLHWGHYNGEDHDKHRVVDTQNHDVARPEGHDYGFAWDQAQDGQGRLLWYIDGRPVMKAAIPQGIRRIADFQVKLNIAMGGNVMQGQRPDNGEYEMVVHNMGLFDSPPGGWDAVERDWRNTPEGHGY